ncbi:xanthine dehydrogenase accessory factor [Halogranum gelatinilyticum]|uniref:Xanthine dehydrogenase accessory factor n=1 Tax=Halogranum gelatinilyticum TaxID=660521 RepID=A0A1G9SI39_9EURY|nr:XdhC/CoxI family protein [Halogranum gelatinilyticum]SDM34967.1 xanthine dehydrogenase accessory factor [Halogranum gelatinilyticum]
MTDDTDVPSPAVATDGGTSPSDEGADGWDATPLGSYRALRASLRTGRPAAVATVTNVQGSAYRRPGAKLVVAGDGNSTGAVTAGCLEDAVADLARAAVDDGKARVERFDLTADAGGEVWGMGLGCNGVIDLLVEPVDESLAPAVDELDAKRTVVVATAVGSDSSEIAVGDRTTLTTDGDRVARDRPGLPDAVLDAIADDVAALRESGASATVTVETDAGTVEVFVDTLTPAPELLVFGRQRDVPPVARLGREAGFRVRVVTGRGGSADADRFPAAHEVLPTRSPDLASLVDAPATTYAVVMSHNFVDDRLALESLLDTPIPYIGLMGPRKRFAEMREAFAEEGSPLGDADLSRVSTPVGLDLGGDHPTQIALSVVSEVLAVHNGRTGGRLAHHGGPVHRRATPPGSHD